MMRRNHSRSPRLACTAEQAEHPECIFQASIWIQAWTVSLGNGRTGSEVESTASKYCSATPIVGQPGEQRKDFYPGYCRSQNTFQTAALSLHPHDLLSKTDSQELFYGLGFFGGLGCFGGVGFFQLVDFFDFFFPLSWFTLHSQDVIKVQSEERRGTSSVSAISSTSC